MVAFFESDIYPSGLFYNDTSNSVTPDAETQEKLHEDASTINNGTNTASTKQILMGVGLIACLVIFFGAS